MTHHSAGTGGSLHLPHGGQGDRGQVGLGTEQGSRDERDKSLVTSVWTIVARALQANMISPLNEELLARFYPLQTISSSNVAPAPLFRCTSVFLSLCIPASCSAERRGLQLPRGAGPGQGPAERRHPLICTAG